MAISSLRSCPLGYAMLQRCYNHLKNKVFQAHVRKFILQLIDGLLIYSQDRKSHLKHLEITFTLLQRHWLFVKQSKCEFGLQQIRYLGHIFSSKGVAMDPIKIEAVLQGQQSRSLKHLRAFGA